MAFGGETGQMLQQLLLFLGDHFFSPVEKFEVFSPKVLAGLGRTHSWRMGKLIQDYRGWRDSTAVKMLALHSVIRV